MRATINVIIERLRKAGELPRLVAPADEAPPPPLVSGPREPTRFVGRRKVNDRGGGGYA
jgi:hypothetical protein